MRIRPLCYFPLWTIAAAFQTKFSCYYKIQTFTARCSTCSQRTVPQWLRSPIHRPHKIIPRRVVAQTSSCLRLSSGPLEEGKVDDSNEKDIHNPVTQSLQRILNTLRIENAPLQFVLVLLLYTSHLVVLSSSAVTFPVQLVPNNKGHFASIGWDSIVGIATLLVYVRYRNTLQKPQQAASRTSSSSTFSSPPYPWNLPRDNLRFRISSFITTAALVQAYFWTGRFSLFWEDTVYSLSGLGFYITQPLQRSLCVLLGHLSWVAAGTALLRWVPRPPKFFNSNNVVVDSSISSRSSDDGGDGSKEESNTTPYKWFHSKIRQSNWLWWTIGGYCVSSWLFNIADGINQYIMPASLLLDQETSVVSQLITPEHNDVAASVVGYIAPCLSAPWWEEILYRGFALPVATQLLGYWSAVFWQGVIFSAHHMSLTAALPLAVLGWTWAILYRECRNLWVVMLVHGLWNSRVFLSSWLGF